MTRMMRWTIWIALCAAPRMLCGQTPDTTKPITLAPTVVSVTRAARPLTQTPLSIHTIDRLQISRARPTWGLDEALATVPGVFVANRYNFSQDQRISIRGARYQDPGGRHSTNAPRWSGPAHEPRAGRSGPDRSTARIGIGAVRKRLG